MYAQVGKNGVSPFQNMCAYLGGSAIQTVGDNPVTAYRQLVQQYARPMAKFGLAGIFRGQGIGIAKAIVSLTLFHEGRIFITNQFKQHNLKKLEP